MPGVISNAPQAGRMNVYGIEASSLVSWQGWRPGMEYTKTIILKNFNMNTLKIKYKPPETRFFTTMFPKTITMSAGTSFTLPVTFRPIEQVYYEDRIMFVTCAGSFVIPMRAVLPKFELLVDSEISLGVCAVGDVCQTTFELRNNSELTTQFHIDTCEPFSIYPSDGILQPCTSACITASFQPTAATIYDREAVVRYGKDLSELHELECCAQTTLTGTGKFPHLTVSCCQPVVSEPHGKSPTEAVVNFGTVAVGQRVEKFIELNNVSTVNALFTVEHPVIGNGLAEQVFVCRQKTGCVPAKKSIKIPISYTAKTVGTTYIDYFHVESKGLPTRAVIKCVGQVNGPLISLCPNVINFHVVNNGDCSTKPFTVRNDSDSPAAFQFQIDVEESVFKLDILSGTLAPRGAQSIIVRFMPEHAINYYRRVACVVHNQGIVWLDLIGTCHSDVYTPSPLAPIHIQRYYLYVERGLSLRSPEELNKLAACGALVPDAIGALYSADPCQDPCPVACPAPRAVEEYFNDGHHSDVISVTPHVSLDTNIADFGRVTNFEFIEQHAVNITNHTLGRVAVIWMGDANHVFSVSPSTADIQPLKSACFRVTFRPRAFNQLYASELECYAFYKSMRDYRLTEDKTHFPPWCLTVTATANTFPLSCEPFIPRCAIDPPSLVYAVVNPQEGDYRTLLVTNTGSNPILFDIHRDATGMFAPKATKGMIPAQGNQVFVVKYTAQDVGKIHKRTLQLRLNDLDTHTKEIPVCGSAETAEILLENEGSIYFKPTCLATVSPNLYAIKNISRIPLFFEWKIRESDVDTLRIEPSRGVIQPKKKKVPTATLR